MSEEQTIWQKQEALRRWHDSQYVKEYPGSTFTTGRTLCGSDEKWEALTPERQEHKERVAFRLNCMLFGLGLHLSENFGEEVENNNETEA